MNCYSLIIAIIIRTTFVSHAPGTAVQNVVTLYLFYVTEYSDLSHISICPLLESLSLVQPHTHSPVASFPLIFNRLKNKNKNRKPLETQPQMKKHLAAEGE